MEVRSSAAKLFIGNLARLVLLKKGNLAMFGMQGKRLLWIGVILAGFAPQVDGADPSLDLSHVPANAVAAVVVHPQRLLESPELELLPWEVIQVEGQREWGIDLLALETVIALAAAPTPETPPDWGIILRFQEPQTVAESWLAGTAAATVDEAPYRRARWPREASFCQIDPQTLLVGSEPLLRAMITAEDTSSPLLERLASAPMEHHVTAVLAVTPLHDLIRQMTADVPIPPPLEPLREGLEQLEAVIATVDFGSEPGAAPTGPRLQLIATDGAAAEQLEAAVVQALGFGKQMLLGQVMQDWQPDVEDPSERAMQQYIFRVADTIEKGLRPVRQDNRLEIEVRTDYATTGMLVGLLLPAVSAAREAARRAQGSNHLRQLALAMHNYHDTHLGFPAAYNVDEEGTPLLSWRVHLLPFLGQQRLYEEFRLDEPWDSPHNRQVIDQMPDLYRAPGSQAAAGKTCFLGVYGEEMAFGPPEKPGAPPTGHHMGSFTGGLSNTVLIVEASDALAVEWTRPADYQPDPDQPLRGLVGLRPGGFQAAFADGSVRMLSGLIEPETLRRLFNKTQGHSGW